MQNLSDDPLAGPAITIRISSFSHTLIIFTIIQQQTCFSQYIIISSANKLYSTCINRFRTLRSITKNQYRFAKGRSFFLNAATIRQYKC